MGREAADASTSIMIYSTPPEEIPISFTIWNTYVTVPWILRCATAAANTAKPAAEAHKEYAPIQP